MFDGPWPPPSGVGRTPDGDGWCTDSRGKMHWTGIISDIQPSAANEFRKFRNCQAQQNNGSFDVVSDEAGERFFARTRSNDNGESTLRQTTSDLAEPSCFPPLSLHDRPGMYHDVRPALQLFLNARGLCGMRFIPKSGRTLTPHAEPLKGSHGGFYSMHRVHRRRYTTMV